MVDINYINNGFSDSEFTNPYYTLEKALNEFETEYHTLLEEVALQNDMYSLEYDITGIMTEANKEKKRENSETVLGKIGRMVRTLIKSILDFCDACVQKIKDVVFACKSNEKKMNRLVREHPELSKEKIQVLCDEGGLDFSDFKSFESMDKAFYNLLKLAKDESVGSDTFKGKCEQFKEKVSKERTSLQTAAKVATATTALIGVGTAISKAKSASKEAHASSIELKHQITKEQHELYTELNSLKSHDEVEKEGKFRLLLDMWYLKNGYKSKVVGNRVSKVTRLSKSIASALDKIVGSSFGRFVGGDVHGNFKKDMKDRFKDTKKYYKDKERKSSRRK